MHHKEKAGMARSKAKLLLAAGVILAAVSAGVSVAAPKAAFVREGVEAQKEMSAPKEEERTQHLSTPDTVRAIYMTECAVGTPSLRESLVTLIEDTELNAVVIDIKDYTGRLAFTPEDPELAASQSDACGANDMKEFITELHAKNVYVIGRITVFQDPYYTKLHPELAVKRASDPSAVWKDRKGLSFIDVNAKPFWDYIVRISRASYEIGFDELNFDYIRFPSDGNMKDTYYSWGAGIPKQEALEHFFKYLSEALKPSGVVISADLFGMAATNYDDLNIGQVLERALPYFDFIDPMVYPSHYPSGFHGYKNVNEHPYDIVHFSMKTAVTRTVATTSQIASFAHSRIGTSTPAIYSKPSYPASKMRPWLQDFDYPVPYTPAMVRAQIKANEDAGLKSYLFWDPANRYDSLRQVLQTE